MMMKKILMTGALCSVSLLATGAAMAQAVVGQPAPAITAADATGKPVALSDFKGKYVVLEWTNPECPFVQKHYNSGNMPAAQKEAVAKGVALMPRRRASGLRRQLVRSRGSTMDG